MGDKGRISRAVAPLLGNILSFATLEQEGQSAPGQFTIYEIVKQINELPCRRTDSFSNSFIYVDTSATELYFIG